MFLAKEVPVPIGAKPKTRDRRELHQEFQFLLVAQDKLGVPAIGKASVLVLVFRKMSRSTEQLCKGFSEVECPRTLGNEDSFPIQLDERFRIALSESLDKPNVCVFGGVEVLAIPTEHYIRGRVPATPTFHDTPAGESLLQYSLRKLNMSIAFERMASARMATRSCLVFAGSLSKA